MNFMRCFDAELIKDVVTTPGLWETVSDDSVHPDKFIPDVEGQCWLAAIDGGCLLGFFQYHPLNGTTLIAHPHILPQFRGKRAFKAGKDQFDWMFSEYVKYNKIVGFIPFIYKNVKIYCNMIGMKDEGVCSKSYMKDGELHDQWIVGKVKPWAE